MNCPTSPDYFELFGMAHSFRLDSERLAQSYRALQQAVHPDLHAHSGAQQQRLSVQQAALVNEAYQTLKTPLTRARYLLQIHGFDLDEGGGSTVDQAFLLEQMELREGLAECRHASDPLTSLKRVRSRVKLRQQELIDGLNDHFDDGSHRAMEQARVLVQKLQFMHRLLDEAISMEEDLLHELET